MEASVRAFPIIARALSLYQVFGSEMVKLLPLSKHLKSWWTRCGERKGLFSAIQIALAGGQYVVRFSCSLSSGNLLSSMSQIWLMLLVSVISKCH